MRYPSLTLPLLCGAFRFTTPVHSFALPRTPSIGLKKFTADKRLNHANFRNGMKDHSPASASFLALVPPQFEEDSEESKEVDDSISATVWEITKAVAVVSFVLLFFNPVTIIDPGEVGIVNGLGSISQIEPGIHLINPLQTVAYFSTKTQLLDQKNYVPTKEGLTVELDTSVLYRIKPECAKDIYQTIGKSYERTIVVPEVSSAVRGLTSESDAKALYSGGGRNLIQSSLKKELSERLEERGILIEDVLLKNIKLPEQLTASIEAKAKAEQESSRMEFVLAKERQEAERKAVEAQGIADFQRIVSDGISPNLLKWKGIEATEKLAQSPNAKVVVIGSGRDGLPLILGGGNEASVK